MLNNNFIRVITFISIILLFFTVSVYDPSVYAKIQAIEDDSLAQINGESGVTLSLNLTVGSVATSVSLGNSSNQYIEFVGDGTPGNALIIGNSAAPKDGFGVSTNVTIDVGTSGGQTWLSMNGLALPSSTANGINVYAGNLTIVDPTGGTQHLGNIAISGIVLGQGVTVSGAPNLTGVSPVAMNITGHSGSGITINASMAAYVKSLTWYLNTSGGTMSLSNIYVYSYTQDNGGTTQDSWNQITTGNAMINNMTMDIGSNGSANGTILAINAPMSASIRVGNAYMGGTNFGPIESNGMTVSRCIVTIRNLNASGF